MINDDKTKKIAGLGMMFALALVLQFLESLIHVLLNIIDQQILFLFALLHQILEIFLPQIPLLQQEDHIEHQPQYHDEHWREMRGKIISYLSENEHTALLGHGDVSVGQGTFLCPISWDTETSPDPPP